MTLFLIHLFVKDSRQLQDPRVRRAYGTLASVVSILCNVLLFVCKFLAGTIFGSVAIAADGVNNLTDASSNIISLAGFKLAARPADQHHPFGHARFEYLSGLVVSVLVLVIGIELGKAGLEQVIHPEPVVFSWLSVLVLTLSIFVKLWMSRFNRKIGRLIRSTALEATADDCRNDVLSTAAVLIATFLSGYSDVRLDGWMTLGVAAFILYSGVGLVRETVDPILGAAPSPELVEYIRKKALEYPEVLGVHDLMVHDYGPGRRFASMHLEMAAEGDVMASHDLIDNIERRFLEEDDLNMVIHFDPIVTSDAAVGDLRHWLTKAVRSIHPSLNIHDLRTVPGPTHTNVIFDCVAPRDFLLSDDELKRQITRIVEEKDPSYVCVVTLEHSFAPIPHTREEV